MNSISFQGAFLYRTPSADQLIKTLNNEKVKEKEKGFLDEPDKLVVKGLGKYDVLMLTENDKDIFEAAIKKAKTKTSDIVSAISEVLIEVFTEKAIKEGRIITKEVGVDKT
jgi:hypothetical protein